VAVLATRHIPSLVAIPRLKRFIGGSPNPTPDTSLGRFNSPIFLCHSKLTRTQ
jgi:hypothetical protein